MDQAFDDISSVVKTSKRKWGSNYRSDGLDSPQSIEGDIHAHYDAHIRPHCAVFEQSRLDALAESAKRKPLGIGGSIAALVLTVLLCIFIPAGTDGDLYMLIVILAAVGIVAIWVWVQWPKHLYKASIKEQIFPHIFSFFGADYTYNAGAEGISVDSLRPSGIIPSYNKNDEKTEDYVRGFHQGVGLELFEAKMWRGSGKHRKQVFSGMFVKLLMNKSFQGHTVVKSDGGKLMNFLSDKASKLDNVRLEDPRFEKMFEVYSSDQIEARYLLTPAFMERLLHLETLLIGDKKERKRSSIQAAFYEKHLLLMIPTNQDRFEVRSINEPVTFYQDINMILAEMADIFGLVEHLKLHERTRL